MTDHKSYDLLEIALAGAHLTGDNISITTYSYDLDKYFHYLKDGGIVIDKRPAFKKSEYASYHAVIAGPIVNTALPSGHVQRFLESKQEKISGKRDRLGALDYIDAHTHAAKWWELGARIGIRRKNEIIWDDGEADMIFTPIR